MKKLCRYLILAVLSPFALMGYGLFALLKGARRYPGSFPRTHRWYRLELPTRLARCSDGSPYSVYLKKGSANKLVVFFSGGGVSWNEYTAARPMTVLRMLRGQDSYYFPRVRTYFELMNGGMLAARHADNPFDDWNVILLPYCSGDFHVGNNEFHYPNLRGRDRLLYHQGAVNVSAALESVRAAFEEPEQLLIAGESAGAFGCVAQAPTVVSFFPGCKNIAVYSDSGQLFWPQVETVVREVWKADPELSDCLVSGGNLILDWFTWLYGKMGDRLIYLQSCSIYDDVLSTFQNKLIHDAFTLDQRALLEFNVHLSETVKTLPSRIPTYRCFLSEQDKKESNGSTAHTAARYKRFYSPASQGVTLAAWLDDAVNRGKCYNVGLELLVDQPQVADAGR